MNKSEIYDTVVNEVCEVCQIRRESLISTLRMQDVVDARAMMVRFLRGAGMTFEAIALHIIREQEGDMDACPPKDDLKRKAKTYRKLYYGYSFRESRMMRILYNTVRGNLLRNYELIVNQE